MINLCRAVRCSHVCIIRQIHYNSTFQMIMKKCFIILWFDMHATYYCNFLKFLWLCWLHNTQKYIIKPYVSISKTTRTKPLYWSNLLPYNGTYCTKVNLLQVNFWTVFANIILVKRYRIGYLHGLARIMISYFIH